VPGTFEDQLAIVAELLHEIERMEDGERRASRRSPPSAYERELRLAGLAQRVAQSYTLIEGVLAHVARRIDRSPVTGDDWHKKLISRSALPFDEPARPAVISAASAADLMELCEFRHVVRNIYPTRLDKAKVRENLERLIRVARAFAAECETFGSGLSPPRKRGRRRR
jgi:hypothetical protein